MNLPNVSLITDNSISVIKIRNTSYCILYDHLLATELRLFHTNRKFQPNTNQRQFTLSSVKMVKIRLTYADLAYRIARSRQRSLMELFVPDASTIVVHRATGLN